MILSRVLRALGAVGAAALASVACSGSSSTNFTGGACACTAIADPVCGTDGVTYESGCDAECAGARIAKAGYCSGGECGCAPDSTPVCGANGVTYANACSARCASEPVASVGACGTPDAGSDAAPDAKRAGDAGPGACGPGVCGAGQVCVDDACAQTTCYPLDDASGCDPGYTYRLGGCGPGGSTAGSCNRACPSPTHHCVDVPPSCSPASCACLSPDLCSDRGSCGYVSEGIVYCVEGGAVAAP